MAMRPPCKKRDLTRHVRIARLTLQGVSCRQAVIQISGEAPGQANFERLYRNHLLNHNWYEQFVEDLNRERCDMENTAKLAEKHEREEARKRVKEWHEDYWSRFSN